MKNKSNLPAIIAFDKRQLPSIQELHSDKELAIKNNDFQCYINTPPHEDWVLKHPIIKKEILNEKGIKVKVPYEYIPIERVEWLLNNIYGGYQREIKEVKLIANSVQVTVKIHYINPITGQINFQDGVGAVPLQTDKGEKANDSEKMKTNAVQLAVPAAASFAVKDAAGQLGRIFGRDLNRADESYYMSQREKFEKAEITSLQRELSSLMEKCQDYELKALIIDEITTAEAENKLTTENIQSWINQLK